MQELFLVVDKVEVVPVLPVMLLDLLVLIIQEVEEVEVLLQMHQTLGHRLKVVMEEMVL